jgi:hypothetical protein
MKSFRQYLIEGGKLNARWSNWLNSLNTEHPNAPKEASYKDRIRSGDEGRIPKEPGAFELAVAGSQRESNATSAKLGSHPRGAFSSLDVQGNPRGGFFSISHEARLINSKTGQRKLKADSLLVDSNRTEEGDLEFKIRKFSPFGDEKDIHRYILPAGETNLNAESGEGHMQKPGASHVMSITDASRVIREHMLSQIKTGKKDMMGQTVAEANDIEV